VHCYVTTASQTFSAFTKPNTAETLDHLCVSRCVQKCSTPAAKVMTELLPTNTSHRQFHTVARCLSPYGS
jgi:hypothetical protein